VLQARRPRPLLHFAHVDTAADEIVPGGVDVLDREEQPVTGARLHRREALAEVDRALRVGRSELHRPDLVAEGQVGVQPPSDAPIEALRPIDIGNGQRHHLEPHVHTLSALHPGHRSTA
jgi:hypothetical protein